MSHAVDRRSAPSLGAGSRIPWERGGRNGAVYKRGPQLRGHAVRSVRRGEGMADFALALGERIRTVRVEAQVSADELAAACGVHVTTVHHWESGSMRKRPTLARIVQIAIALGVQPVDLMPTDEQ